MYFAHRQRRFEIPELYGDVGRVKGSCNGKKKKTKESTQSKETGRWLKGLSDYHLNGNSIWSVAGISGNCDACNRNRWQNQREK